MRIKVLLLLLSISLSDQTAVYKIYTVSREPIRLPEIQYPVFCIIINIINP